MRIYIVCLLFAAYLPAVAAEEFDSAYIAGKVTDAGGKPLAGAAVRWNLASGAKVDTTRPFGTTTNGDGQYELMLRFAKDQTLTVKEVFAEIEGYCRAAPRVSIPLRGDDRAKLDFQLEKGEVLAGTMHLPLLPRERDLPKVSQDAVSKRMFLVNGPKLAGLATNARLYLTEPSGRFKLYLPPGEYSLEVLNYGTAPVQWKGLQTGRDDLVLEPTPFEWSEAEVGRVFDELHAGMDANYSYFILKKDVDWQALKEKYRPQAIAAKSAGELAAVLQEMLSQLRDPHVWIQTPTETLPTFRSSYTYNGNRQLTLAQLENRTECGTFAIVGRTKGDGFGYFLMLRQSDATPADVQKAVQAIGKLGDAPAFIVDLRSANGGSEPLAAEIARQFCGKEAVYAKSKYRNGPRHEDFGAENERILPATLAAFTKPVVCLIGPGASSSGEGFVKMMKCLPHVTTVGLPTRGASGNPKPWELSRTGLTVFFSRWVDLMPNGQTFEGVGIPPEVQVEMPADANRDPTLEKGLDVLREKVAAIRNKAGS